MQGRGPRKRPFTFAVTAPTVLLMFPQQRSLHFSWAVLCLTVSLNGCGGNAILPPPNTSPPVSPAILNGNWLLIGNLPLSGLSGSASGVSGTFHVTGDQVEAALTYRDPCSTVRPFPPLTGTIAENGKFNLAFSSPSASLTATLSGAISANSSATWGGHLTMNGSTICGPLSQDADFTAARISDVTGTYTGTASLTGTIGSSIPAGQNAQITFVLKQDNEAAMVSPPYGVLFGTISLQGTPCLSMASVTTSSSVVAGSELWMETTMNDGSRPQFVGELHDVGAVTISIFDTSGFSGSCGAYVVRSFTLTKQ